MKKISLKLVFGCALFAVSHAAVAQSSEKYYRPITKQEKAREKTAKPCEFVWNPVGEQLIREMAVDYQNALFAVNYISMEDGDEKNSMKELLAKYPTEFGIRSTGVSVISAIDQLESSFDLVKDTIVPSGMKQEGFFYDPNDKPADSLMADLRKDPASVSEYAGKYYEVWSFKNDSSETKVAIVFTSLGFEKINLLHREEANIKTDYSALKNEFANADEQRAEIRRARKEHPLDYGLVLGEEYQWNLSDTWRDIVINPTPTEEELAAKKPAAKKK